MFPAQMTSLHLVSRQMKRQFTHTDTPEAFNLAGTLFVGMKMASVLLMKRALLLKDLPTCPFPQKIILWGRTEKCLKETAEEITLSGTECHYFLCDVANREEVYKQAKVVREKVGDVSVLVNNAAVVHGKSLMDSDDDALLKSQHINTMGQFWTTKAFLPRMLELQHGHVVCINSILSQSPIPGAIDYCTSKASSLAFMESLTLGLLDCPGVGCTTVLPFHTNTEMFQGMRVRFPQLFPPLRPEVVAERTVDAVRADKAFLYLPWTMHALIFLKSFMPQVALEEIHKFSGSYTCMNTFKGRT
uniref:Short-chain dehydrogenase/reductase 3 n=1 Tax=Nothobranchius furzeri TaxID=105023 RepID=A0A8C6PTF3_NOTFU